MKVFSFLLMLTALVNPPSGSNISPRYISTVDSLQVLEKVYLHTDRDSYYPGEDIWFKAYLIDATDRLLTSHSLNLHVELISPDSKIIDSRIVRLNEGLGNGDFRLPKALQSGQYRLKAYTNYMRNFSDLLFFNKDITIINPTNASKTFSDTTDYIKNKLEISFFPEGGSLVDDVTSFVAFKAVNALGEGCDVSGEIYSSSGEKITSFKSTHKGMGAFPMTAVTGLTYYALAKDQYGDEVKIEIPKSFPTGVVLNVAGNKHNELVMTVRTNKETLPLILDHDLLLAVSARNEAFKTVSFRMKSLNSYLNLGTDDLPDGIIMLTLSGLNSLPLCERLVYLQNNEDPRVQLETNKTIYNKRDSVSVRINLSDSSGIERTAFLSLSVTGKIFVNNSSPFPSTISSWFLLESDVRGPVEEPSYYFNQSNPSRLKDLDLLLLTQGWRDFEWKYQTMVYPPEYGFTISGRVRKTFADVPLKNSSVTLAIFESGKPLIASLPVDSSGKFSLKGINLTGSAKLIASVSDNKDNMKGLLLLDSTNYTPPGINDFKTHAKIIQDNSQLPTDALENLTNKKKLDTFIRYAEIKSSIQKKYKLSDTIQLGEVDVIDHKADWTESPITRSRHYLTGTPDYELKITPIDKAYGTVFNLIKDKYLSQVNVRKGGYDPRMKHPLYMIDGRRAEESEVKALSLDWVERIDVIENSAAMLSLQTIVEFESKDSKGMTVMNYDYADGAISIILKDGAYNKSAYHSATLKFSGYNEPRIFYSPKHHTTLESDYKPDLRTTLFWEPNIKVKNNKELLLNYYNADNSSVIRVTVEGITIILPKIRTTG